jgi:anti-sigma factor RsiW
VVAAGPGNFAAVTNDSLSMDCEECREVSSAELDGEAAPDEAAAAHAHLERCPACRRAVERAIWVTRIARIGLAEHCPDLTRVEAAAAAAWADMMARAPRPGLGALIELSDLRAGADSCGCLATCACGCQNGAPCQCGSKAA